MNVPLYSIPLAAIFLFFNITESRVIALIEPSSHEASLLVPLERSLEKEMRKKGVRFHPTKQKKHITLAILTKFHETLRDLQNKNPQVVNQLALWLRQKPSFSITRLLNQAHVEMWEPPYFKGQYYQKYPDYYNLVLTFPLFKPLESFVAEMDQELRKIPKYRYNRRRSFKPHITLGKVYPRGRRFTHKEVADIRATTHYLNSHMQSHIPPARFLDQVFCLLIKESNTQKICLPLRKK